MSEFNNPTIAALAKRINPKLIWDQALLRNTDESRFELRHVEDTNTESESLGQPQLTDYRKFTERQTGIYRITAKLTPEQNKPAAAACSHPASCLKQRRWTIWRQITPV